MARRQHPELEWGSAEYLLSALLDTANFIAWTKTRDAEKNRNRPDRVTTPADRARVARKIEHTDRAFVDRALGKPGGGAHGR